MLIQKDNLMIRNAILSDATILCRWWNDGRVMAHAGYPNGINTTEKEIIDSIVNDTDTTHRRLIICFNDIPIGEMNYRNKGDDVAEIGIKICDFDHQNKGYGTTLLKMIIGALFGELRYTKLILDTNLSNLRAQHVYEKLGFRKLRVNVNSWKDQIGELQSSVEYEITREDFAPENLK